MKQLLSHHSLLNGQERSQIAPAVRLIAFYLPQFHPIPENDAWWGAGFTEWRNVVAAKQRFRGHYQPHLPADLGFYDLRLAELREAQTKLAAAYGVYGFCYYHYWFNGRRLLQRPFTEVLESGKPDFPFCLCWANEDWTRAWDGHDRDVLLAQSYSAEDDRRHIEALLPALNDDRYIRIGGRPLLLVYRTELLPNPASTAAIWRDAAVRGGIGDLYLVRVESFVSGLDPKSIGFDAAVEFPPGPFHGPRRLQRAWLDAKVSALLSATGIVSSGYSNNLVIPYERASQWMLAQPSPTYPRFRTVTPSWDNSPRRTTDALILHGSTPAAYEAWLRHIVDQTVEQSDPEHRLVFVNAWNEWAEGSHLEPDLRWGRAYLEATKRAVGA